MLYLPSETPSIDLTNSSLTRTHWIGIKLILRYFKGTTNMCLFYPNDSKSDLIGYKQDICSHVMAQQFHGGL